MEIRETELAGVRLLRRTIHTDERGTFDVIWNAAECAAAGIAEDFVQDNLIITRRGTLRGMHYQSRHPQGKLLTVLEGEVYDAIVDLRVSSATFGKSWGAILRADAQESLWVPPRFCSRILCHEQTRHLPLQSHRPMGVGTRTFPRLE